MTERWLPVVGWEGDYSVSDHGRVRSEPVVVIRTNGRPYTRTGRILQPTAHKSGHLRVTLKRVGQMEIIEVHRLVLAAFVGPKPDGMESLHWDDVPSNNRLSNLRYGTRSENKLDLVRNGRWGNARHCAHGHEFTPENTYHYGRSRQCKTCTFDRTRARRTARKELTS
jgi:hypothetical protein